MPIKISQLPEATQLDGVDLIGFVKVGLDNAKTNKKITVENIFNNVNTDLTVNSDAISGLHFRVNGGVKPDLIHVNTTDDSIALTGSGIEISDCNVTMVNALQISSKEILLVPATYASSHLSSIHEISEIYLDGSSVATYDYVLGVGTEGQTKIVYIKDYPSTCAITLYPDTSNGVTFIGVGANGIKLNAKGASVMLKAVSSLQWVVVGYYEALIDTP